MSILFFYRSGHPPDLPSFPTRRSSDLPAGTVHRAWTAGGVRPLRRAQEGAGRARRPRAVLQAAAQVEAVRPRSEEHTSELQSLRHLVCRLLLEKKKKK